MISVALCDDQQVFLKWLHNAVSDCLRQIGIADAVVKDYSNPSDLLEAINSEDGVDIAILDVMMPDMDGMDIGAAIRRRHDSTALIFISSSLDYAIEAFSFNAVHYLPKPVKMQDLLEALQRAAEPLLSNERKMIMLNPRAGVFRNVDIHLIDYIESQGYRRIVHAGGEMIPELRKSLSEMGEELEKLSPGQFQRLHRWCIVNLDSIRYLSAESVCLRNGEKLPMRSRSFRAMRDSFFRWSFRSKE